MLSTSSSAPSFDEQIAADPALLGFEWGNHHFKAINKRRVHLVNFDWDPNRSSKKLQILTPGDSLHPDFIGDSIVVKDGSGFKNAIGDCVSSGRDKKDCS
jgi:hypothetical protein